MLCDGGRQITQAPNETVEHPVGQSRPPFLGFDRPFYAPRAVENQLATRAGLLIRFGSSQHLKMAALVDSKAEVETDPIKEKAARTGGSVSNSGGTRREAGALRPTTTAATRA